MGAGDEHLRTLGGPAHLHHIDPQAAALLIGLAPHLLVDAEVGLRALGAAADAQGHCTAAGINPGDDASEDLVLLGGELVIDHPLLRLPDSLNDDLAGSLGGDAAEVLGLDLNADGVPQLHSGQGQAGLLQADLSARIVHLLHHLFFQEHADHSGLLVGLHGQVVTHPLVVPAVGGDQGLGDLFHHIALFDALLLLDLGDGGKKLLAVQLGAVDLFRYSLSHGNSS